MKGWLVMSDVGDRNFQAELHEKRGTRGRDIWRLGGREIDSPIERPVEEGEEGLRLFPFFAAWRLQGCDQATFRLFFFFFWDSVYCRTC